jgi:histidinol-phosphate aminotransferase
MDEAYLEYLDKPIDLLPEIRAGRRPNLILARTFSKIYGLAGLRLGYAIGHPDTIAILEKIREPFNVNSVAQAAALAALDDSEHVIRTRSVNRQGLLQLETGFAELGLQFVPSAANFILLRVGEGQRVFQEMQNQGVIVRPMAGYQLPEWVRISVGTSAENKRCLGALRNVVQSSQPR